MQHHPKLGQYTYVLTYILGTHLQFHFHGPCFICTLHKFLLKWVLHIFSQASRHWEHKKRACYQYFSNTTATQWLLPAHFHMKIMWYTVFHGKCCFFPVIIWLLGFVENNTRLLHKKQLFGSCIGMELCNQLACHKAYKPKGT